nr:MarR family transcriptional regulator [Sphingobium subterraneum]
MYRVLASLREQPGQKLSDLAETTVVELSTMSRMIGTLVTNGLVTRERLPNNERTVSINLTKEGIRIADLLIKEAMHYEEVAVRNLATADIEKLRFLLNEIHDLLDVLESEQESLLQ